MLGNGIKTPICDMGLEWKFDRMDLFTKATGQMTSLMEKEE